LAPRIALPSSLTCIGGRGQSFSPASRLAVAGVANPAAFISHVPAATPGASAPASVRTRQIVVFDGGGAGAAPLRPMLLPAGPGEAQSQFRLPLTTATLIRAFSGLGDENCACQCFPRTEAVTNVQQALAARQFNSAAVLDDGEVSGYVLASDLQSETDTIEPHYARSPSAL
jgi:hypothetical protein